MDRQKVKDFFQYKKDNSAKIKLWGVALIIVGIILLSYGSALMGIILAGGGGALFYYAQKNKYDDSSEWEAVKFYKQKDIASLLNRAFEKANVDINDLVDFQASDMMNFEQLAAGGSSNEQDLHRKSVILLGPPKSFRLKVVKVGKQFQGIEINPWRVTILFLTQSQLITYDGELDITRGDLNSEMFHRMFLKDVVQIGTSTNSERISIEPSDKNNFAEEIREMLGPNVKEIVRRNYLVNISKTDGHALEFPIGIPEWRDGTVGALDQATSDEDIRYTRIAQEMSQRIDEMKRGLSVD